MPPSHGRIRQGCFDLANVSEQVMTCSICGFCGHREYTVQELAQGQGYAG